MSNYPTATDNATEATTYNGWANYETWNISLYINNEYNLYQLACAYVRNMKENHMRIDFTDLISTLEDVATSKTPDGVKWCSMKANLDELNEMLDDLVDIY